MWVKLNTEFPNGGIAGQMNTASGDRWGLFARSSAPNISGYVFSGTGYYTQASLPTNEWELVTLVLRKGATGFDNLLYFGGDLVDTNYVPKSSLTFGVYQFFIGGRPGGSFDGHIHSGAVWTREIDAATLQHLKETTHP